MSVLTVKEIGHTSGDVDDKLARRYTRTFQVVCDSTLDGPYQVGSALGIPRIGDIYATPTEFDFGARCTSVKPERDTDNLILWTVTAEYSNKSENPEKSQAKKPLERRAKISWQQEDSQRPLQKATLIVENDDGTITEFPDSPIKNSASDHYDPPVEIQDPKVVLQIVKNQATFSPQLAFEYRKAVNADPFFGAAPGQWKVKQITGEEAFEEGLVYWVVTYRFDFREDGWDIVLLDAGYNERVVADSTGPTIKYDKKVIVGKDQTPLAKPSPLNGRGVPLDVDAPDEAYVYTRWSHYPKKPYSALTLP